MAPFRGDDNIEASVHECERKVLLLQVCKVGFSCYYMHAKLGLYHRFGIKYNHQDSQTEGEDVQFVTNTLMIIQLKSACTTNLGGTKATLMVEQNLRY